MKNNIFIAPKIKVGFQSRTDCFTGKLAYIIYYDTQGKIRKEVSWKGWIDDKIPIEEYDNSPMEGFTLNRDVKRYNGDWFSSKRTLIRVHDPRGFEFEITTENLIAVLMHTDCLRRGLIGQFVYAWAGKELILLPVTSAEYQSALQFTGGMAKKVTAKELVEGVSYKTKKQADVVYMGKLRYFRFESKPGVQERDSILAQMEHRGYIFTDDDGRSFFTKSSLSFLSEANTTCPVSNFPYLMDAYNKQAYSNRIVKYELRPATFDYTIKSNYRHASYNREEFPYFVKDKNNDGFRSVVIEVNLEYVRLMNDSRQGEYQFDSFSIRCHEYGAFYLIYPITGELQLVNRNDEYSYNWANSSRYNKLNLYQIKQMQLFDLYIIFENGTEQKMKNTWDLIYGTSLR